METNPLVREIIRGALKGFPWVGPTLEHWLFHTEYSGVLEKKWQQRTMDLLLQIVDDKNFHQEILEGNVNKTNLEAALAEETRESMTKVLAEERAKEDSEFLVDRLRTRFNLKETNSLLLKLADKATDKSTGIDDLFLAIRTKTCLDQSVTQAIVLPPYITHLHIIIFKTLFMLAYAGFKINILILDTPYMPLSVKVADDPMTSWPPMSEALHNVYRMVERLPKEMEYNAAISKKIFIIRESRLMAEGHTWTKDFRSLQDKLIQAPDLAPLLQKTSLYLRAPGTYIMTHSLIREFFFAMTPLKSRYVILGPDRFNIWASFLNSIRDSHLDQFPRYLFVQPVPPRNGDNIKLDMNMCFTTSPKTNPTGPASPEFLEWFSREHNISSPTTDTVDSYYSKFNELTKIEQINEALIKELSSDPNYVGCYCFGGQEYTRSVRQYRDLAHQRMTNPTDSATGDIDLLFVVKEKNIETAFQIESALAPFGNVNFHPDFYSKREVNEVFFEIIVVPQGSSYFKKRGLLTGLSALSESKTTQIFGKHPIDEVLRLPKTSDYSEAKTRIKAYASCDYGINHMAAVLYTRITAGDDKTDYSRVIKYIALDYAWVNTGEFYLGSTKNETIEKLMEYYSQTDKDIHEILTQEFNPKNDQRSSKKVKPAALAFLLVEHISEKLRKKKESSTS